MSDIYVIKDSFADNARKEKVIKPREHFPGFIKKDPADPRVLSVKFPDSGIAQKMQQVFDGCSLDGLGITAGVSGSRANRAWGSMWVRRALFETDADDDAMSTASSLTDNMSTTSGYSGAIEQANVRRATGATVAGSSSGGVSRPLSGVVLSADQTGDLRDVLNSATDARGVQLVQQPDGGIGISQSLGADASHDGP